jgi:hypothetical protein
MSNMQDRLLQIMQLIQYPHVSSFSTGITNQFVGEDFYLSQHSMDGYEAMGFDLTLLTQDEEKTLFAIKTNMPIPMLVYGDAFQWAKYGNPILPLNIDLTSHNKAGLHQFFWNSLIEFLRTDLDGNLLPSNLDLTSHNKADLHQTFGKSLIEFICTDLDGNLSFTMNPLTASKLEHYLSTLFEGLLETANGGEMFDQHVWNEKSKHCFINEMVDNALSATQIPLSIFTNLLHRRFEKHSLLESTLEILQQFYIQMETEPHDFLLFPGDSSLYILRCIRCDQHVTVADSIGETPLHTPTAMLYHWNMIQSHDEQNHRESMLMPLLFTSYDNYLGSLKSFQVRSSWLGGVKFGCQKPTKYGQFMFYKAVKVDMENFKETSFNNTISSTLSLITVLFEDLFEAVNIQQEFCGEKEDPKPSITLLNKTNTCDGYDFNINIINTDEYNALQKELLMLFEAYCIFGSREFYRNLLCILVEVNKTMYGNNEDVPKRFWAICIQNHTYLMSHLQLCGMSLRQMKTRV